MENNRDNLSGLKFGSIISFIYMLPGIIILWLNYMSPRGGIVGVAKSSRHARSPIMTFFISTIVWAIVGFYFLENSNQIKIIEYIEKVISSFI